MDTNANDAQPSIEKEIAAAEAELRAAQEKLEAAQAKASLEEDANEVDEAVQATVVEATVVESGPIELEAVPAPQTENQDPDWIPVASVGGQPHDAAQNQANTTQAQGQPASQVEANSYDPYQGASAQVSPSAEQPQGGYYWQQPQQGSGQYDYNGQYAAPQNPYAQPQQQYYQQPYAPVVAAKDHVAAGLLAIFLGSLGIHKFYLGYNTAGFIMLAVSILGGLLTFGLAAAVMGLIGFIEGILYLVKSQSEFEQIYVFSKREWF